MRTVTKKELIDRIADKTGNKRVVVKRIIQSFLDEIIGELANSNRLEFRDFGVFEPRKKAPRLARNPRTGEKIQVPQKVTVKFKAGRMMMVGDGKRFSDNTYVGSLADATMLAMTGKVAKLSRPNAAAKTRAG